METLEAACLMGGGRQSGCPSQGAGSRCHSDEQVYGGEKGEVEKQSGPCIGRERELEDGSEGQAGVSCPLVSIDVHGPCYQQRP